MSDCSTESTTSSNSSFPPEGLDLRAFFVSLHHPRHGASPPQKSNYNIPPSASTKEMDDLEANLPAGIFRDLLALVDDDESVTPSSSLTSASPPPESDSDEEYGPPPGLPPPYRGFRGTVNYSAVISSFVDYKEPLERRYDALFPPLLRFPWYVEPTPWGAATIHPAPWYEHLEVAGGVSPADDSWFTERGRDIVHGHRWDEDNLVELVQYIFWKGAEPCRSDPLAVALLASKIHGQFKIIEDEQNAGLFTWMIQECVKGYCAAFWDAQNKESAIRYNRDAGCYSPAYIHCANRSVVFAGFLKSCNVIDDETVLHCLWLLLSQITAVEHLAVIMALIQCSGVYYRADTRPGYLMVSMYRFIRNLLMKVNQILANNPQVRPVLEAIIQLVALQSGLDVDSLLHQSLHIS
ncbi:hypothetical protein EV360DRAFT_66822 [Lentinula raphanica]|nr:hypothetical protein EV360DRAFT_66822 [Lentinula raphanica]